MLIISVYMVYISARSFNFGGSQGNSGFSGYGGSGGGLSGYGGGRTGGLGGYGGSSRGYGGFGESKGGSSSYGHGGSGGGTHESEGYGSGRNSPHVGDEGIKAMVVAKEVIHEKDGKIYTKDAAREALFGPENSVKSVDQKIHEMRIMALADEQDSLAMKAETARLMAEKKAVEARKKMEKAEILKHQEEDIEKVLHSPQELLEKDVIPVVGVTPDSLGFQHHDELELARLNQLRLASLQEAEMQKNNALLHEKPDPKSPVEDLKANPDLIKKFFENAPVNRMSATVDPSKGKFSLKNEGGGHNENGHGFGRNNRRPVHGRGPFGGNTYANRHPISHGGYSPWY